VSRGATRQGPAAPSAARPALAIACALLLVLGTVRLFAVVLHDPLLGYANQFDMVRTSACVDLYPDLPVPDRYSAQQWAPVPYYVAHQRAGAGCYPATNVAVVAVAKTLIEIAQAAGQVPDGRYPLQAVGVLQAAILAAVVLAFVRAERARPWARLGHASVYAFILADPTSTLWLNTLYTEPAGLIAAYAMLGMLALPAARLAAPRTAAAMLAALLAFALSRQQAMAFAVVPLIVLAPVGWRGARAAWIAGVLALGVAAWLQSSSLATMPSIRAANIANVYLGAVLPAVRDEPRALAQLGLPETCRAAIGGGAYVGMGADPSTQCTEVARLGRFAFLRLVADDPVLPWRILLRGLPEAQAWWQHQLGMVAGRHYGDLAAQAWWLALSPANWTERMPLPAYFFALGALAATFVAAGIAWVRMIRRGRADDGWLRCVLACSALGLHVVVSGIFGDGYEDVAKHALFLHMGTAALILLGLGRVLARPAPETAGGVSAKALGLTLMLAVMFAGALLGAARQWPLARGVIDTPQTRQLGAGDYALRGWAIDPFGVDGVQIAAYEAAGAATPRAVWEVPANRPKTGSLGDSLQRYYPTYPGSADGGFAFDVPRDVPAGGAPCLVTRVRNRLGVMTEIDRRCLTP
jgi:hypothetical protein